MFGLMRHAPRLPYCGTCKTMGALYGQRSRVFLSHDVVFLAELLLEFTVMPIMLVLLSRYVFGGAIETPGYSYVDFLVPGVVVQNIAFGGFVTAIGLNEDVHKGLIDRFRSLPMARPPYSPGARRQTS